MNKNGNNKEEVKEIVAGPLWIIVLICLAVFTMPSIVKALTDPTYSKIGIDSIYLILWFWLPGLLVGVYSLVKLFK